MPELDVTWRPVAEALERRSRAGRRAQFWLRDDDAVEPSPALDRLLTICQGSNIPLVLAVIPQPTGEALAERLRDYDDVAVAVHGWSHQNHAGPGEKKQELGPHRAPETVSGELRHGLNKLKALHPTRMIPMLVPPWNRVDPNLLPALGGMGFEVLSTFGPPKSGPIPTVNSNVDLIDWHGTRGCLDHAILARLIAAQMERPEPVGILAHHLVHDEAAWAFLETLFVYTRSFGVEWLSGKQLLKVPA